MSASASRGTHTLYRRYTQQINKMPSAMKVNMLASREVWWTLSHNQEKRYWSSFDFKLSLTLLNNHLPTFDIPEHRVDRQMHAPPQPRVTWISLLDHTLPLVKAPVHVACDEVGALVMAPDESRVHLSNDLIR